MKAFFANRAPSVESEKRPGVATREFVQEKLSPQATGPSETMLSFTILPVYLVVAALLIVGAVAA